MKWARQIVFLDVGFLTLFSATWLASSERGVFLTSNLTS